MTKPFDFRSGAHNKQGESNHRDGEARETLAEPITRLGGLRKYASFVRSTIARNG